MFNLDSVKNYNKILYLDTDILVKDDINKIFDVCKDDILYTMEEGAIDHVNGNFWGKLLFGNEINNYDDKSAFSSGILLFNNCEKIKDLFNKINEDIIKRPDDFHEQPHIVYNAFKYNLYNNKILKNLVVNNDNNIHSDKVIHHFSEGSGEYEHKINIMTIFLNSIKDFTIHNIINEAKNYININLLPIINNCEELLEGNIFMLHNTTTYTDIYLNKSKNISNIVLNKNLKNVMEIGFNAGFSTLLMLLSNPNINITCFDLGEHKYTMSCYNKMKETFGNRINIIIGDSTKTLPNINDKYELIHIDGGHSTEVANSDIVNSYRLSNEGTILIMNDYDFSNLQNLWDNYIIKYNLKKLDIHVYNSPHQDIKYINTVIVDSSISLIPVQLTYNCVVSRYKKNVDFVYKLKNINKHYIYDKEIPENIYNIPINKGNEASVYLKYIIDHYENLADFTFFIHDDEYAWHHSGSIIDCFNEAVMSNKLYYNINDKCILGSIVSSNWYNDILIWYNKYIEEYIPWNNLPNKDFTLNYRGSAQFLVHKSLIRNLPLKFYENLYNWLMTTELECSRSGRYFEYTWHIFWEIYPTIINKKIEN